MFITISRSTVELKIYFFNIKVVRAVVKIKRQYNFFLYLIDSADVSSRKILTRFFV